MLQHNILHQALPTFIEHTNRDTENVPIFYIEELPNFGLIYVCFTNAEDRTRHIRSNKAYLHICLWLDRYAVVVPHASPTGGEGDQGLIEPYTAFSIGFTFSICTDHHPICIRKKSFGPK
ncbi:hypothetical protein FISHEDRAFT_76806 [Fistulina hepatica ATCC 64428]|uniref:Uncharacterized protein n=1 Tax=Fistulina hepatica ATCC 64428 TaxID=1128425 RepID=A0A0D7A5M6_9AGAR|nr:hypothetical protein FISHEDRAFT_76806 [Fistulina hepatica ATCC 64428]